MGEHSCRMLDAGEEPDEELAKGGAAPSSPLVKEEQG
jgi:hypothetical protein